MESKRQPKLVYTFPPAPTTVRGESTHISLNKDGSAITYCSGTNVIIRKTDDLTQCDVYIDHNCDTTTAAWAPSGHYIASGDIKGNVRVWDIHNSTHVAKRVWENTMPGKIKDISWSGDSRALVIAGEGNQVFGKPLNVETGSGLGELGGHSRTLLTAAFKPERPYRLFTGGEDKSLNFYEGTPFKFKRSHSDVHNNFITCIRMNPKGDIAVSTGMDKKLVSYDATSGDVLHVVAEKAHEGTVTSIAFVDDKTFVTSSMDKTLKLWDLAENKSINSYNLSEKPEIGDMQVGVAVAKNNLISVSLDGTLNLWKNFKETKEGSLPDSHFRGHNAGIISAIYSTQKELLISADQNGKILVWKGKEAILPAGKGNEKKVLGMALSASEKEVYIITLDDKVKVLNLDSLEFKDQVEFKTPSSIVASKKQDGLIYIAVTSKKFIAVLDKLTIVKEHKLGFDPLSIDISNDEKSLYVGDQTGVVHVIDPATGEEIRKFTHYSGIRVTCVRVSRKNDELLATADSKGQIRLWSLTEKEEKLLTDEWVHHPTTVGSLSFSPDNKLLVSSSFDNRVHIWDTQSLKKLHDLLAIHKNGITTAIFYKDSDNIITAGGDNILRNFAIQE